MRSVDVTERNSCRGRCHPRTIRQSAIGQLESQEHLVVSEKGRGVGDHRYGAGKLANL